MFFKENNWAINWHKEYDLFRVSYHDLEACMPMTQKEFQSFKKFLKRTINHSCNMMCGSILCDAIRFSSSTTIQYQLRKNEHRLTFSLESDQIEKLIKALIEDE